jgi:hypothetical protein
MEHWPHLMPHGKMVRCVAIGFQPAFLVGCQGVGCLRRSEMEILIETRFFCMFGLQISLILADMQLDDELTIAGYSIRDGSTLHLVL